MDINNIPQELIEKTYEDIHKQKSYIKLKETHKALLSRKNFAQAMLIAQKMKDYEVDVFEGVLRSYLGKRRISEDIVKSMSIEDRKKMNILANSMLLLSDVLDAMTMDAQSIMKKYTGGRITDFEKLNNVLKETKPLVSYFDNQLKDEKAQTIFGECSDNLYKMVFNKASSFVNKLKRHEEDTHKKTA